MLGFDAISAEALCALGLGNLAGVGGRDLSAAQTQAMWMMANQRFRRGISRSVRKSDLTEKSLVALLLRVAETDFLHKRNEEAAYAVLLSEL